ncbi:Zinc-type alcohol dehydrogenase-like protein PB24D3.08c [Psilocybe cubensis]|uniref:Enoyl reductase (ER) domain-containing protein n=2 Tax=Psilocybe cubensis TaxID=181762 RepID=A0A8H7XZT2_PSICU|nr:Zinc-type alcohol dehydrogenase-like protein PB24D3.08c [Psilocybe cubensis]KAH9481061.1 Zinc-type alcohol dehydrogenase-like protein PB24D3.08c [Psilocybe cubensis]
MTSNPRIVFAKRPAPHELPKIGEHLIFDESRTIDLENVPLNGGFLTKTLILSPEPAMRERMRDPSIPSYTTTFNVGGPILGFGVVVVLRSEKDGFKPGDYLYGLTVWEAYTVQPYIDGRVNFKAEEWSPGTFDMDSLALQVVPNPNGLYPLSKYTSIMGTPGLTAFVGMEGIIDGKEGETLFVSSGASAVGSMVIQLAKLKGMKVIASAGSDAKVEYMRSLGADLPFNYKKVSYAEFLKKHGPINKFWDNVGAEALDAALESITSYGKMAICGTSGTDATPPNEHYRLKNAYLIMKKCINIRGFIVPDLIPQFIGKFFETVPALMAQGKLRSEETEYDGIESAPQAFIDTLSSGHQKAGTLVVVVARD